MDVVGLGGVGLRGAVEHSSSSGQRWCRINCHSLVWM
jgi:hypothetical protein